MDSNFEIKIRDGFTPKQEFNSRIYRLYPNERYFSRGTKRMHVAGWEYYNGKIPKGYSIHHKNENTWDNRIENLELKESNLHLREHGKKRCENKEWFDKFHSKGIEKAKEWHSSELGKEWHSEHGKKSWNNRQYEIKLCEFCRKEYSTRQPIGSKFCSQKCKAGNRRREFVKSGLRSDGKQRS